MEHTTQFDLIFIKCGQSSSNCLPQSQDQMQGRFLLNVIVGKSTSILELLTCEDKTLLIRGDALLILNLGLNVVDTVRWLDL